MITIFLGTFNRLETLRRTIRSYENMRGDFEIVIVDNGTDSYKCQCLLDELEKNPMVRKIYRLNKVFSMPELTDNYNIAISDQYKTNKSSWYAVTDADISFEATDQYALYKYVKIAKDLRAAAGPHTRVDAGLSVGYPLRSRIFATESRLLYRDTMRWWKKIPYSYWAIDTTFHVFPRVSEHMRLKLHTVRVGPPYDAMHLDWYVDFNHPTDENWIYITGPGPVGSFGKGWIAGFWIAYQHDPEFAYNLLIRGPFCDDDYCNQSFMISWCYQFGFGVEKNIRESLRWLLRAIPGHNHTILEKKSDWLDMIYRNDFSSLGWS